MIVFVGYKSPDLSTVIITQRTQQSKYVLWIAMK